MVEAGGVSPSDFGRIEGADITTCPPRFLDLAPSLQGNYVLKVMPFPGGQGGLWPTWNLGVKLLNLISYRGADYAQHNAKNLLL